MFYKRTLENTLENLATTFPVILITGPRQGSLLKEYGKDRFSYVSLDNLLTRAEALKDPQTFLEKYDLPVIDEYSMLLILWFI